MKYFLVNYALLLAAVVIGFGLGQFYEKTKP
jgi:hypothetical protein